MAASKRLLGALSALLLAPAAASADDSPSYEFLRRQAGLQDQYGRLGEAVASMEAACATPEGGADRACWRRLAAVAERAGRIGVAVDAWRHAAALGDPQGRSEGDRLAGAYGRVVFALPRGRGLPTGPVVLDYEGLILDPAVKAYLRRAQESLAQDGIQDVELWLPVGSYSLGRTGWTVQAGQPTDVILPPSLVPYRHQAFGLGGRAPAGVAGPFELGGDLHLALGGAPGGGLGLSPAALGGRGRVGVHLGPLRVEAGLRAEAWPVVSRSAPGSDREMSGATVLGSLDVGVDLMLAPRAFLTPHGGLVGGSLGSALVDCVAEQPAAGRVLKGECRLGAAGVGGQAGVDLWLIPPSPGGRLTVRAGLSAEAGAGGLQAAPADPIGGGEDLRLLRMDRPRFAWLRAGVDVGVSLRF